MGDKTWKAAERRYAKDLTRGKRNPVTGERAAADVESPVAAIQVKRGYRMPGYLRKWMAGIKSFASGVSDSPIPLVVWQTKGGEDTESVVLMRWEDFVRLHNTNREFEG
jgi:hypothetical protein